MSAPTPETAPPAPGTLPLPERDRALELLRWMLLVRRFEERCVPLYTQERIRGFLHLYIGEEAVSAGSIPLLRPEDSVVSTYREHGHALVRGVPATAVMAEMFGVQEGCARGRGGSMHLFHRETRFFGGNAIVGGGIPLAVGLAQAARMQGEDRVAACYFGDGATAEGAFHESLNLAALWRLPVLFLCENNRYAMGTALEISQAQTDLALKAASHGVPAWSVDGMDVLAVEDATRRALATVRGGGGPVFLELRTYRFRAHSMFDPELYRTKEEVERWKERDPIPAFKRRLEEAGMLDENDWEDMEAGVEREVEEAVRFAEEGTLEPVEDLTRFVHSEDGRP